LAGALLARFLVTFFAVALLARFFVVFFRLVFFAGVRLFAMAPPSSGTLSETLPRASS
jgi:hypothetical protein